MVRKKRPRQPRLAEVVADHLRTAILDGTLRDGDLLPRQEELIQQYGVGQATVREALRALQTEGLITVQRGNVGGAIVHVPGGRSVARVVGFVLQNRAAKVSDVRTALMLLEPVCAGLCATRPDRHTTVLPLLADAHKRQLAAADDIEQWGSTSNSYHDVLVSACGSETLEVVIGALQEIWAAHANQAWGETLTDRPSSSDATTPITDEERRAFDASIREHERLTALIEAGDATGASALVASHLEQNRSLAETVVDQMVISARTISGDLPPRYS